MLNITFVQPNGSRNTVTTDPGVSVMQVAVSNGIAGLIGDCGGACSCATCHVFVDDDWVSDLPSPNDMEESMLECTAEERRPTSRLSCEIKLDVKLDGLVVHVPSRQF
ncbi:ferredoxin [Burkholderia sp. H160]|nr:ferredoxin [Burkholderia sp. H160]